MRWLIALAPMETVRPDQLPYICCRVVAVGCIKDGARREGGWEGLKLLPCPQLAASCHNSQWTHSPVQ